MTELKVGDTVRVIHNGIFQGEVGKITHIFPKWQEAAPYQVDLKKAFTPPQFTAYDLELVSEDAPPIPFIE